MSPRQPILVDGLALSGERTVPDLTEENYWFRRHEAAYRLLLDRWPVRDRVVVEAGCGEGYGAAAISEGGAVVVAVDNDSTAADHARAKYPTVRVIRANLVSLPLADRCADLVVGLQVIEHLWDPDAFLDECHRVLRPGGTVVVSTPNRPTFSPGLGRGERPTNPFHFEEYDCEQLRAMLEKAGFADPVIDGLTHGPRLRALETANGSLVARQIEVILKQREWPAELLADVSAVAVADFEIGPVDVDALDLIASGIATRP